MPQDYTPAPNAAQVGAQEEMKRLVALILRQYDRLYDKASQHRIVIQQLADYIVPAKSNIVRKRQKDARNTDFVFDGTAEDSNTKLASFLASSLTSMAIQFFSLRLPERMLKEDIEVSRWLDDAATICYEEFKASNFSTETQECYVDIGFSGTMCLQHTEKKGDAVWNGALFKAHAPGTYVCSENAEGKVNVIFVELEMTLAAMVEQWGIDKLSEKSRQKYAKDPFTDVKIVWGVFPQELYLKLQGPKSKPFWSCYIEYEHKHLIDLGGFEEFPFHVARWRKVSGEVYGRGPGHAALPDIRTINRADELTLKAWAKAIDPPLLVLADQIVGRVKTTPAALVVARTKDALTPIPQGANWQANTQEFEKRRTNIRNAFFADQLQLPDKTIITATEVERRIEMAQQILGPVVGRLEYEYLDPCVSRMFNELNRAGKVPPPPPQLVEATQRTGTKVRVQYEGPLARAARGGELQAINRLMTNAAAYIEINPRSEMLDRVNEDALFDFLADASGAPAFILRDEAATKAIREQRAKAAEQQAQAQSASQMGTGAAQGAKALQTMQAIQQGGEAGGPTAVA